MAFDPILWAQINRSESSGVGNHVVSFDWEKYEDYIAPNGDLKISDVVPTTEEAYGICALVDMTVTASDGTQTNIRHLYTINPDTPITETDFGDVYILSDPIIPVAEIELEFVLRVVRDGDTAEKGIFLLNYVGLSGGNQTYTGTVDVVIPNENERINLIQYGFNSDESIEVEIPTQDALRMIANVAKGITKYAIFFQYGLIYYIYFDAFACVEAGGVIAAICGATGNPTPFQIIIHYNPAENTAYITVELLSTT